MRQRRVAGISWVQCNTGTKPLATSGRTSLSRLPGFDLRISPARYHSWGISPVSWPSALAISSPLIFLRRWLPRLRRSLRRPRQQKRVGRIPWLLRRTRPRDRGRRRLAHCHTRKIFPCRQWVGIAHPLSNRHRLNVLVAIGTQNSV